MSKQIVLECISGPLDGELITLTEETKWSKTGTGPLAFPWDNELGDPQAGLFIKDGEWWIEGYNTEHGTYLATGEGTKIKEPVKLSKGDVLVSHLTFLTVDRFE